MKNFTAQQLSKKQMNEVKGGDGGLDNCGTLYKVTMGDRINYVCSNNGLEMQAYQSIGAIIEPANETSTLGHSSKETMGQVTTGFES